STRLYKPRLPFYILVSRLRYFNPRGCISLDADDREKTSPYNISIHEAV
ncbi:hypothetical protein HMPREF1548_06391, partial [Clostridium sp. KLE 1755]